MTTKDDMKLYRQTYYQRTKEKREREYRDMTPEQKEKLSQRSKEYYLKKKERLAREKEMQWKSAS